MSLYAKIDANDSVILYPYTTEDFRNENPYTKIKPDLAAAYQGTEDQVENNTDVVLVNETTRPSETLTQNVEEGTPILSEGSWVQAWNMVDKSAEEISVSDAAASNTGIRNDVLRKSDFTQLLDAPLTDAEKAAYSTWRQELRDITQHSNWPDLSNEDWPNEPGSYVNDSRIS